MRPDVYDQIIAGADDPLEAARALADECRRKDLAVRRLTIQLSLKTGRLLSLLQQIANPDVRRN